MLAIWLDVYLLESDKPVVRIAAATRYVRNRQLPQIIWRYEREDFPARHYYRQEYAGRAARAS